MIFKKFSILLHTIILSVILVSCESDFFKSNDREENDLFSVEEAESIFNRNDGGIRLPVFKDAPTNGYTIWHRALAVEADKVGHELAHFWFKHEYPSINLKNNLNSELISTLAELVYSMDTYNGEYYLMSKFNTGEISEIIKPFWDNPSYDNLDSIVDKFMEKRGKDYKDFVFDRGSFLGQVENFKNLFR